VQLNHITLNGQSLAAQSPQTITGEACEVAVEGSTAWTA
jgi:hypothetical protein